MRSRDRYLYLSRHNIFYFRIVVQVAGNTSHVKHEYRRSLKTRDPKVARYRGRVLRLCFEDYCISGEVDALERGEIRKILDKKLTQLVAEAKDKITREGPCTVKEEQGWERLHLPFLRNMIKDFSDKRINQAPGQDILVPQSVDQMVNEIFDEHNIISFQSEEQYLQVCEATLHMMMRFTQ